MSKKEMKKRAAALVAKKETPRSQSMKQLYTPKKGSGTAIGDCVWLTNEKTTFKKSHKKKNDAVRFAWARKSRFKFSFLVNCDVRHLVMGSRATGPTVPY